MYVRKYQETRQNQTKVLKYYIVELKLHPVFFILDISSSSSLTFAPPTLILPPPRPPFLLFSAHRPSLKREPGRSVHSLFPLYKMSPSPVFVLPCLTVLLVLACEYRPVSGCLFFDGAGGRKSVSRGIRAADKIFGRKKK